MIEEKPKYVSPSGIEIIGSVDLVVRARIKKGYEARKALRLTVEQMYDRNLLPLDKFERLAVLFLYGIKTDLKPRYDRIDKKNKYLSISVELDTLVLRWANKHNFELLKEIFMIATCEAVLDVLRKYKLPTEPVERVRNDYGTIPRTVEECEENYEKLT